MTTNRSRRFERSAIGIVTIVLATVSLVILSHSSASTGAGSLPVPRTAPAAAPSQGGPPISLRGGTPTVDALLDEFLAALERKDVAAMHALRVTKDEYLQIIVPGTVGKGEAPREISAEPREFFWQLTDRKSSYAADNIIENFGGRHFTARNVRLSKGVNEYLWYTSYGQVRLDLRTAERSDVFHLKTGSIAEVNGRYKFLAFNWNE